MPTYEYRDTITGITYEVMQKITEPSFKTLAELHHYRGWANPLRNNPLERLINCEGGAIITGAGVYKSGLISGASHSKPRQKLGVTKFTAEEIMAQKDEEEDE